MWKNFVSSIYFFLFCFFFLISFFMACIFKKLSYIAMGTWEKNKQKIWFFFQHFNFNQLSCHFFISLGLLLRKKCENAHKWTIIRQNRNKLNESEAKKKENNMKYERSLCNSFCSFYGWFRSSYDLLCTWNCIILFISRSNCCCCSPFFFFFCEYWLLKSIRQRL